MKKFLILTVLILCAGFVYGADTLDTDTRRVTVSTIPTSATLLFTASSWGDAKENGWILNDSGFNLAIHPTNVITTNTISGLFFIPAGTTFSFGVYKGSLYGVIVGTDVPKSVGVIRTK